MEHGKDKIAAVTVPFCDAAAWVLARVATLRRERPVVVVGVTGPVGSGKTTLAHAIVSQSAEPGLVLSTDHYLPDYERVEYVERDEPKHSDLPLLSSHLQDLRDGRDVQVPIWSFQSHSREGTSRVSPAPLIICEGIHALHAHVRPALDVALFVHAAAATRWQRWKAIEERGERGWGVDVAQAFFDDVAEPTYTRHAHDYLRHADVIVENDG
jgi:uridine kinase